MSQRKDFMDRNEVTKFFGTRLMAVDFLHFQNHKDKVETLESWTLHTFIYFKNIAYFHIISRITKFSAYNWASCLKKRPKIVFFDCWEFSFDASRVKKSDRKLYLYNLYNFFSDVRRSSTPTATTNWRTSTRKFASRDGNFWVVVNVKSWVEKS